MGICTSSACDTRATPASVRLMTTFLVLLHLCSCGLLRTFLQHCHRALTGLLLQVSDIFTIKLGSRSSSCPHGGPMPLLLPLITRCARQRGKAVPSTASTHPAVFVIHHDAAGASTPQRMERGRSSPQRLHSSPPLWLSRIRLQMPNVTLATAENNFMPGLQQGAHRQQVLGY